MTTRSLRHGTPALGKVLLHETNDHRLIYRAGRNLLKTQPMGEVARYAQVSPRDIRRVTTIMEMRRHSVEDFTKRASTKTVQNMRSRKESV